MRVVSRTREVVQAGWKIVMFLVMTAVMTPGTAAAQYPGGVLETAASTTVRPKPTPAELEAMLPQRGVFMFPAPYNTIGARLTNASDCGGTDCVSGLPANGWPMISNSIGSDVLYVGLTLDRTNGGVGPAIFRINKTTGETVNMGALFDAEDDRSWLGTDGWYFSRSQPTSIYVSIDSQLQRYDILTRTTTVVFDVSTAYGDQIVWFAHSSSDDRVHSFLMTPGDIWAPPSCGIFDENTHQFTFVASQGTLASCEVDKSGQWLLMKEDRDGSGELDHRIIYLPLGSEASLLAADGVAGPSNLGFGAMIAGDSSYPLPSAIRAWTFGPLVPGPVVYHSLPGLPPSMTQIAFSNARSAPLDQQYACGGAVNRLDGPRANEIVCVRLDGTLATLAIAPVMTDLDAAGGGPDDDEIKQPYGTLDPTGQYFLWLSNVGGDRFDAFMVAVPGHVLVTMPTDITAPSVTMTSPLASTLSGEATLTVTASDNTGVTGVQFKVDGADLGPQVMTAPYSLIWNTISASNGVHVLTAVAYDAAGNTGVSLPVVVTVSNADASPDVSGITVEAITHNTATISWMTDRDSTSEVEYGTTAAYGESVMLSSLGTLHSVELQNLTAGTDYHFRVTSRTASGQHTKSDDMSFTTLVPPAPTFTYLAATGITKNSAVITWTTDQPTVGRVEYGTTSAYGQVTAYDTDPFLQTETLSNLQPNRTYHYRVSVINSDGQETVSGDNTFTTRRF